MLLPGRKEETDHYQLLQEQAATGAGQRHGIRVEIAWAPAFDQLRVLKKRMLEPAPLHAVVFEPSSLSTMDVLLRELHGRAGLVLLNASSAAIESAARSWERRLPFGTVSTDHAASAASRASSCARLRRADRALRHRTAALVGRAGTAGRAAGDAWRDAAEVVDTEAGAWTEAAGITAFGDWYRIFKARNPRLAAVAAQSDELALGVRQAIRALTDAGHRATLEQAKLFGVDACPGYGRRLVDDGTLTASVTTPANTGLALQLLHGFWSAQRPLPLRSFTAPSPYPPRA